LVTWKLVSNESRAARIRSRGDGVVDRSGFAEITRPHQGCGHIPQLQDLGVPAVTFIVHEEEGLVLATVQFRQDNRTTEASPELIEAESRESRILGAEEIAGVERGVSQKFKQTPM
jgi:hypothetical protein